MALQEMTDLKSAVILDKDQIDQEDAHTIYNLHRETNVVG